MGSTLLALLDAVAAVKALAEAAGCRAHVEVADDRAPLVYLHGPDAEATVRALAVEAGTVASLAEPYGEPRQQHIETTFGGVRIVGFLETVATEAA